MNSKSQPGTLECETLVVSTYTDDTPAAAELRSHPAMSHSKDFFWLIKSIGESRTKQEEDRIVRIELEKLKQCFAKVRTRMSVWTHDTCVCMCVCVCLHVSFRARFACVGACTLLRLTCVCVCELVLLHTP
jgi:hypothetical protein